MNLSSIHFITSVYKKKASIGKCFSSLDSPDCSNSLLDEHLALLLKNWANWKKSENPIDPKCSRRFFFSLLIWRCIRRQKRKKKMWKAKSLGSMRKSPSAAAKRFS